MHFQLFSQMKADKTDTEMMLADVVLHLTGAGFCVLNE
jgi:hypothetical protein